MADSLHAVASTGSAAGEEQLAPSPKAWAASHGLPVGGDRVMGGGGRGQVVSMLLPTRQGGAAGAGRNLTALDTAYVVVLEPGTSYATYCCRLPQPVLI